ncbi:MAG: [Lachnospiraceae bacterium]|nr:[FeFe] hydrogenase H-cluster radical SAM maturase HydE [Lachnospiraceae bacterium]
MDFGVEGENEVELIGLVDRLEAEGILEKGEWIELLENYGEREREYAARKARKIADDIYGKDIYIRGLIEFTNYCKNDCFYCGIRRGNQKAERYRLSKEQILSCCESGWKLGFRTFVLQGGEDGYYADEWYEDVIQSIKELYPECAITLSIGERSKKSYERLYQAGAARYLLRHETANEEHYGKLHPKEMSLKNRKKCLMELKEIGYQTGCGFMVGSPFQSVETLAEDMMFIHQLKPHMVGIGPFIPHEDTPFAKEPQGNLSLTLFLLSLIRIMEKRVLLPATTALGTIDPNGRELGILAGANVIMPNLSPVNVRKKYMLYDNKICTGEEAAECRGCIDRRMESIGYEIVCVRGDYKEA